MRRDLGNRASPVNRAHMKRPLGPLHMARLPGRILSSVHMGNFSPVTGMKKSRKGRETWTEALGTSLSMRS